MKRILLIGLIAFTGCSELFPGNGCFRVKTVQEGPRVSHYQLIQTKGNGATWIEADRGLYHVGDTICFSCPK